jgi:hypothetical protein
MDLLFRVVRCICEEVGENPTVDPITTSEEYSVYVGIDEIIIEQQEPDLLH